MLSLLLINPLLSGSLLGTRRGEIRQGAGFTGSPASPACTTGPVLP